MTLISEDLLAPEQLAELLGVSVHTLETWRSEKKGPAYYRPGRKVFYRKADVEIWIESTRKETADSHGAQKARRGLVVSDLHRRTGGRIKDHRFGRNEIKREGGDSNPR